MEAQYAVKMPLEFAGQTEFIWIEVQSIAEDQITGSLANDSMHDRTVKAGQTVTAPLSDLNDWMILKGEEMTGGFTVPVLMRQA